MEEVTSEFASPEVRMREDIPERGSHECTGMEAGERMGLQAAVASGTSGEKVIMVVEAGWCPMQSRLGEVLQTRRETLSNYQANTWQNPDWHLGFLTPRPVSRPLLSCAAATSRLWLPKFKSTNMK